MSFRKYIRKLEGKSSVLETHPLVGKVFEGEFSNYLDIKYDYLVEVISGNAYPQGENYVRFYKGKHRQYNNLAMPVNIGWRTGLGCTYKILEVLEREREYP